MGNLIKKIYMKTRLFVIFILFHFVSFGQTSHSLVDTNKLWSNLWHTGGGPPPYIYETNFIKFFGDTVIDLNTYKKVHQTYDSTQSTWFVIGYIREDSNHRVYYYRQQDSLEMLLYDFSAQVGDTLVIFINHKVVVDSIDSVFVYDRYVKRLSLSTSFNKSYYQTPKFWGIQWYEGIGDMCGVLNSGNGDAVGTVSDLLCYYENDTLKYHSPLYNECYYDYTVDVADYYVNNVKATIFPNPVVSTSILKVENMRDKKIKLEIYSLLGQKLMTTVIGEQTIINKSDFESGIYIYRIVANSFVWSGKFEIE